MDAGGGDMSFLCRLGGAATALALPPLLLLCDEGPTLDDTTDSSSSSSGGLSSVNSKTSIMIVPVDKKAGCSWQALCLFMIV